MSDIRKAIWLRSDLGSPWSEVARECDFESADVASRAVAKFCKKEGIALPNDAQLDVLRKKRAAVNERLRAEAAERRRLAARSHAWMYGKGEVVP